MALRLNLIYTSFLCTSDKSPGLKGSVAPLKAGFGSPSHPDLFSRPPRHKQTLRCSSPSKSALCLPSRGPRQSPGVSSLRSTSTCSSVASKLSHCEFETGPVLSASPPPRARHPDPGLKARAPLSHSCVGRCPRVLWPVSVLMPSLLTGLFGHELHETLCVHCLIRAPQQGDRFLLSADCSEVK